MGKFKNSADGRTLLIPIVRTMRSAGKGVTQDRAKDDEDGRWKVRGSFRCAFRLSQI
jgi:hypothetical protein